MNTEIVKISEDKLNQAVFKKAGLILRTGGLVAFPTETVYGIGANALNEISVKKIFAAKGRPSDNPLIVHIGEAVEVETYANEISDKAKQLIKAFWPGPLTLIFKKKAVIPFTITGGLSTVAIRLPANRIARKLIQEAGVPIAAPSANISGRPSPTIGKHVIEDLNGKVDMIMDGGSVPIGIESTVLDMTSEIPTILRPGYVTYEMLQNTIGQVAIDKSLYQDDVNHTLPKSPGMKYKHYAPKAELTIIKGRDKDVIRKINTLIKQNNELGYESGVIVSDQNKDQYHTNHVLTLGDKNNTEEIAANLFKCLRTFDESNVTYIYSEAFHEEHMGRAVMNRLIKAAGHRVIEL